MEGIYGFLCWIRGQGAVQRCAYRYGSGSGKELFHYCVKHKLIEKRGVNSIGEDLYSLSDLGEYLINSKNFGEALKEIAKE